MEDEANQKQQPVPAGQMPSYRYFGLLLFITVAVGLLIFSLTSSVLDASGA